MTTKWWIFRLTLLVGLLLRGFRCMGIDLAPDFYGVQTGGGMGAVTVGAGWAYGAKDRWETEVFAGIIPKYDSSSAKGILTVKENFRPWRIAAPKGFSFEPLTASIYFTSVLSNKFWAKQPSRYPSGYYIPPTKFRANIALGQRVNYEPERKWLGISRISAYYELGTCDIYLLNAFGNKYLKPGDWLQLCLGLRLWF